MMLSNPIELYNLNSFLPVDGENNLEISYIDRVLNLEIYYDATHSETHVAKRRIRFYDAKYFFKTPFPGYSFFNCPDHSTKPLLNSLVEYGHSDMLALAIPSNAGGGYRHYRVFLHSTGVAIHVLAESFEISSEELIAVS